MNSYIAVKLIVLIAAVLVSAWCAGSETALFSLTPLTLRRLRKEGHPQAALLASLTSRPRQLLSSLLIGNEFSDIVGSVLASSIALTLLGRPGQFVAIGVMVPVTMLAGEVVPKVSAALNPVHFASRVAAAVAVWMRLVAPVRWVAEGLLALVPGRPEERPVLEEEFIKWVRSSHKEGLVQETERQFIENLIAFERTSLAEVMTPRPDIFALEAETAVPEAIRLLRQHHFSRVPVYAGQEDNVIGILHAKDLLGAAQPKDIRLLLRPAHFAPETKRAEVMLRQMQRRRLHIVLVVDEYGGLAGLVTLDDLLEELFGEFYDEHELAERPVRERAPGVWVVSPRLAVEDFNERLQAALPEEEGYETVGGFLLDAFGRMPTQGEEIAYDGLVFKAARTKGTQILEIEVRRAQAPEGRP